MKCWYKSPGMAMCTVQFHIIVEYPELEETHKDHQVHLLAAHKTTWESDYMSESVVCSLNSDSLEPWTLPWGACSSAWPPASEEPFGEGGRKYKGRGTLIKALPSFWDCHVQGQLSGISQSIPEAILLSRHIPLQVQAYFEKNVIHCCVQFSFKWFMF